MRLGIAELALLVSLFLIGYGIFHIPTGLFASHFGLRRLTLAGMLVESSAGVAPGLAPDDFWLEVFRVLAGIGGSLFVGCGFALAVSWFRGREIALAQGISGGVAFAVDAAVGLFPWVGLVAARGWRTAMVLGGVAGLLILGADTLRLRTPREEAGLLEAGNLRWDGVGRVLRQPTLWLVGLAVLGGMGGDFVVSQLLPTYAATKFHMAPSTAGPLGAVVVLAGIPGSFLAGWWSDRGKNRKPFIRIPAGIAGVATLAVPFSPAALAGVLAVMLGGGGALFAFPALTALPGDRKDDVAPQDVATAEGLLLFLANAIGGFFVPILYGLFAARDGYTAAWVFVGGLTIVLPVIGLFARVPAHRPAAAAPALPGVAADLETAEAPGE
jgi:ACS family D-galactonate transporter-like MFS transporter